MRPRALRYRGDGLGQRERDVEHPLERGDRDALAGLVVALGAVREVHDGEPAREQRVRVGAAAAVDVRGLVAAVAQRPLGGAHRGARGRDAVAVESAREVDVDVALALREVRGLVHAVDELRDELRRALLVLAADLADDDAALGDDVDRAAARDRPDVRGRLGVDAPEAHVGDRARRREDRAAALLGAHPRVGGGPAERRLQAVVGRRGDHDSPIGVALSKV